MKEEWTTIGKEAFDFEDKSRTAVILKFTEKPSLELRQQIREPNLKWNKFREEWYGEISNLDSLKAALKDIEHQIEII